MANFYQILNITENASPGEIKTSYRRLAKRYHPDLNPDNPKAVEQFREVQKAYEVLGDPEKRQAYDATVLSSNRPKNQAQYDHWESNYRTAKRRRPRYRRPMHKPHKPREEYLEYYLEVSLEELFKGSKHVLTVGQTFTCALCGGKGKILIEKEGGENYHQTCSHCDGYGFLVSYEKVEVLIPPGVLPDMTMRVAVGTAPDDQKKEALEMPLNKFITIIIRVKQHPLFSYKDQHLYTTVKIPENFLEQGGEWSLPAPEGGQIVLNIPAHTPSGTTLTVRKHGLRSGSSLKRGNLYCTILAES